MNSLSRCQGTALTPLAQDIPSLHWEYCRVGLTEIIPAYQRIVTLGLIRTMSLLIVRVGSNMSQCR